jgi:hypothetical protein
VIETVKTVLSGAIGIRRRSDAEGARLNPLHVIFAAIVAAVLFILTLVTIVKIVTS